MELKIKIEGKYLFILGIFLIVLAGVIFVNAQITGVPNPGHNSDSVLVTVPINNLPSSLATNPNPPLNPVDYSLQQAIEQNLLDPYLTLYQVSSGDIGVGITNPQNRLQVTGPNARIRLTKEGSIKGLVFDANNIGLSGTGDMILGGTVANSGQTCEVACDSYLGTNARCVVAFAGSGPDPTCTTASTGTGTASIRCLCATSQTF